MRIKDDLGIDSIQVISIMLCFDGGDYLCYTHF
jgi:hypothetical protein